MKLGVNEPMESMKSLISAFWSAFSNPATFEPSPEHVATVSS